MQTPGNPQIRKLKALGQRLEPMLKMGKAGLSDGFVKSVDDALALHELIKVKFDDLKEQKKDLSVQLAARTTSHLVMRVGHVVVLYRPNPDPAKQKIKL
ncbi:MAG: YhbY family RNA-binding protein [Opitutaceae bacterium]|nr:YhbY family RNA-binding protein [Verrucomicrobiales bacterium]